MNLKKSTRKKANKHGCKSQNIYQGKFSQVNKNRAVRG